MKKGLVFRLCLLFTTVFFVFGFQSEKTRDPYFRMRQQMVDRQLAERDITSPQVFDAMGKVPRHLFVLPQDRSRAYIDQPLPIDEGQTISQPYIVALMTQYIDVKHGEKVLEIGTGSGYQAAVLSHFTDFVYSIEIREKLAGKAAQTLEALNYSQVRCKWDDGYFGWAEHAPFDAIIITCAANHIPPPLLDQLKEGGRLIIPLGSTLYHQTLTLVTMKGGEPTVEFISGVRFVPMVGEMEKRKK
jgi:protein-L-isoaspartate(D-aspartate) O-methyltransferase